MTFMQGSYLSRLFAVGCETLAIVLLDNTLISTGGKPTRSIIVAMASTDWCTDSTNLALDADLHITLLGYSWQVLTNLGRIG